VAHVRTVQPPSTNGPEPVAAGRGAAAEIPAPAPDRRAARQLAITVVADVRRPRLAGLKRTLQALGADPATNAMVPFAALPRTHFARLLVLDPDATADGAPIEPHLVYMADVDEPADAEPALERCLEELVDVAGEGLDRIFGACVGYPPPSRATRALRLAFLHAHAVSAAAAYVNTIGRSVRQILQEEQLRIAIRAFLDRRGAELGDREPDEVRTAIRQFVRGRAELAWALTPPPSPSLADRAKDAGHLLALPAGLLALSPVIVPALPLYALALRRQEKRDPDPHISPTRDHVLALAESEDHAPQNQFSAVGFLKAGRLRRLTAEVVTRGIDYAARHVYGHANLAGVKTIHCARWVWLDDHRRLIFASNYDGSLESYNDDFVDKVWWGLNAVFSNGVGWPRTRWLFFDGARQEQAFKDWLRRNQVPTQVWYSAYPQLTALNVENNARIRSGLHQEAMSAKEATRWLRRI
jgi:hypothetical protein